jgi:four helix bundle protein
MSYVKKFEDLDIWQNARKVFQWVLTLRDDLKSNYFLRLYSQIVESSGSVMDNIAEGFERTGNKEFINFLIIAKGSAGETRSQLYRLLDAKIIDNKVFESKRGELEHLSGKISSLIKHLKNSDVKGWRFKEPPAEYE